MSPRGRLTSAAPFLLAIILAACAADAGGPEPTPEPTPGILQPGEQAVNDCERAVLALHAHDGLDDEFGRLEMVVYDTCTWDEFTAFNAKVTDRYQYPGDGRGSTDYNCRRALSAYKGSLLCETSER